MEYTYIESPLGPLLLAGEGEGGGEEECLHYIGFPEGKGRVEPKRDWVEAKQSFAEARRQLAEYFAGERKVFDLALVPTGTPFQLSVLQALAEIPYGATASYRDIAQRIGRPKAVRAVGAANGRNPLPIVIPCHRVVGADGSLTGFGGGLPAKRYLLALETADQGTAFALES
ncbi:MAG: methylated-DNA--[protein]-cysteine S-methyltransferase [Pseudomonadales bacterium]